MQSKPASSFVVFLGKILNGMPPFLCRRQMAGAIPIVMAQSNCILAKRANENLII